VAGLHRAAGPDEPAPRAPQAAAALPEAERFLDAGPRTLRWRPDAPYRLDLAVLDDAYAVAGTDPATGLRRAVEAYTGDLLAGSYDEWLLEERERLRARHLDALHRLSALLAGRAEHEEAIHHAERLVREDPLREDAYRLLMELHDARGERARALRAFHACAAALERELGVGPSDATRAVYEKLLAAEGSACVGSLDRRSGR
jgi:DNA-binding SARP family transcriptional activator